MRWLSLVGAGVFAYLTLIPGGLVVSTFDSACAGADCNQPLAQDILLVVVYVACLAAIGGTAAILAYGFFERGLRSERLTRLGLTASLATTGTVLFVHFALVFPLAALFTLGVGGVVYGSLRYWNGPDPRRDRTPPPDPFAEPSSNGHGNLNGHS